MQNNIQHLKFLTIYFIYLSKINLVLITLVNKLFVNEIMIKIFVAEEKPSSRLLEGNVRQ